MPQKKCCFPSRQDLPRDFSEDFLNFLNRIDRTMKLLGRRWKVPIDWWYRHHRPSSSNEKIVVMLSENIEADRRSSSNAYAIDSIVQLTSQIACEHQHEIIQLAKLLNTFNREWECAAYLCKLKKVSKITLPLQQHYWRFSSGRAHTSPRTWREYTERKRDMKGERNEERRKKEASDKNCRSNKSQHETPWCFGKYLVLKKTPFWSFKQKYIFFSLLHNILDFLYIFLASCTFSLCSCCFFLFDIFPPSSAAQDFSGAFRN